MIRRDCPLVSPGEQSGALAHVVGKEVTDICAKRTEEFMRHAMDAHGNAVYLVALAPPSSLLTSSRRQRSS